MRKIISILILCLISASYATAQTKPAKTQTDLQKTANDLKALGSLFKKKPKPGASSAPVKGDNGMNGPAGTMPPPDDKMFMEPGGATLCADSHGATFLHDGVLYEWGDRTYGQTGGGAAVKTFMPVQVTTDNDWKKVYTGGYINLAIKTDGTLWSWGWGPRGELGLGNTHLIATPTRIGYDTTWVSASGAEGNAAGIKSDGTLWVWGSNVDGQLGVGPTLNSRAEVPMRINKDHDWAKVAAGEGYYIALKKDGSLWGWGYNKSGGVGASTVYETQQAPIRIGHDNDWVKVITGEGGGASFGIKADGSLWAWGYNRDNQLGIGNVPNSFTPVLVGTDRDWVTVANRINYTLAIKSDGSVWKFGYQTKGIQRLNIRGKFIAAAAALNFMVLMRSDSTLWSQGNNSDGGLGYINNANYYTTDFVPITQFPVPVITTKPKAVLAKMLNDEAALLFKQSNSRLSILDKNKIATTLNFKLSADKKQFILNAESVDYPFDVHVYSTDMNKDGVEEVFVFYGNSFTSGNTGSSVMLFMRDVHGDWHSCLDNQGATVNVLPSGTNGYNDLAIGVPGFQYPVFGWNGSNYVRIRNITEAQLTSIKHIDVTTLSKALYKQK